MRTGFELSITIVLVTCALVTSGLVIRHELFSTSPQIRQREQRPIYIETWRAPLQAGIRMGPGDAPVRLIEFADFECPFCGSFHKTLKTIEARHPKEIGLTYVHFPIPGHRFAMLAARVAECANDQGRFEAMYDELYDGQDQFGLKPWDDYATAASVLDLAAFDTCIKMTDTLPRVEEGKALGAKLDVQGTPTIIINGWKLDHPPNEQELNGMVTAILAGRNPVTSDGKFAK